MKQQLTWIGMLMVLVLIAPSAVGADSGQQAFNDGKALLAQADFHGALQAFAQAARADRDNQDYVQHYAMLRQVLALRERLDTENDAARWEYIARGLHAFYVSHGLHGEALALDKKVHARLNTAASATMLAETQLAMDMNVEAGQVLAALDPSSQTAATRALQGIALARQGKAGAARRIAATIALPRDAAPGTVYCAARLHAVIENAEESLRLLTMCFESVAPSRLDSFKNHVKQSPEFAGLVSTADFAKVMETESNVSESKCSGGSRCAGCPMRGKCGKSQGH